MKTYASLFLAIIVLGAEAVAAQTSASTYIYGNEIANLTAKTSSLNVSVVVTPRSVKTKDLLGDASARGQFPEILVVIKNLRITVNGSPIFVPRSTYADLIWVRHAEVSLIGRLPILTLSGGDGSESYLVRIEFDKATVRRRTDFSPALPNKPLQETIYHLRVMEDRG